MSTQTVENVLCNAQVKSQQPAFKGKSKEKVNVEELPDEYVKNSDVPVTKKRKALVGISSIIPGLGQFINGNIGKGFAFLGAGILSFLGAHKANINRKSLDSLESSLKNIEGIKINGLSDKFTDAAIVKNATKGAKTIYYITVALLVATIATSIVDAVKNAKSPKSKAKNVENK